MSEVLGSVWWMLVTLGVLVTFHEFGHYWVARRLGVRVLRFSVGFGKPLWSRTGKDGTEYVVAAIPLGGYVKFLDSREVEVAPGETGEFNSQPLWKRFLIVLAGPMFNLFFAVAAFWCMLVIGKPDYQPVIGEVKGLAAEAGFHAGDRVLIFGDRPVHTWTDVVMGIAENSLERRDVIVAVIDAADTRASRTLRFGALPAGVEGEKAFEAIGITRQSRPLPATVGDVTWRSPAAAAGLQAGDAIVAINGTPVKNFDNLVDTVQAQAAQSSTLAFELDRAGNRISTTVTPERTINKDGKPRWSLGIRGPDPRDTVRRLGPLAAIPAAIGETWDGIGDAFLLVRKMVTGQASAQNLSGVIGIAQAANVSAQMGLAWFLSFLGLISVSLGVLNLLPIPILDGGHLLYYLIELVKGRPVSERTQIAGQYLGLAVIVALMGLALYNDVFRIAGQG